MSFVDVVTLTWVQLDLETAVSDAMHVLLLFCDFQQQQHLSCEQFFVAFLFLLNTTKEAGVNKVRAVCGRRAVTGTYSAERKSTLGSDSALKEIATKHISVIAAFVALLCAALSGLLS